MMKIERFGFVTTGILPNNFLAKYPLEIGRPVEWKITFQSLMNLLPILERLNHNGLRDDDLRCRGQFDVNQSPAPPGQLS